MSVDNDIYVSGQRYSPASSGGRYDGEITSQTTSSRARMERMVFGSSGQESNVDNGNSQGDDSVTLGPERFNFDIKIPALDTYYNETGEI